MSAPAQVTEAHRELAAEVVFHMVHENGDKAAQLIADSEAKACDQLRSEVERLKAQRDNLLKPMREISISVTTKK